MEIVIRPYQTEDESQVIALWQACHLVVGHNDPQQDILRKMQVQPELFLVGILNREVVATVMAGYEGRRGWLNYVAVSPLHQRQGIGGRMVEEAVAKLQDLGAPKVNLQVRASNSAVIAFYEQLGFHVEEVVSMGRRLD